MRTITFWLSLILIFTIPWENIVNYESLGTVSRVVGLLVAGFWVVTVIITGRFRRFHPFHLAIYLFVLWNAITIFWSVDVDNTASRIQTYFQLVGLVLVLWDLYTTPAALRAGLQAYVLGAYVSIVSTIYNYFHANAFYYSRYAASGFNPNDLAIILALGMPIAWYLAMSGDHTKKTYLLKVVNFVYLPAVTYAIFLTASRAGLLAIAFSLLFMLVSLAWLRPAVRVLIFIVLVGFLFVAQDFIPQTSVYVLSKKQGEANGRDVIWETGMGIMDKHPLLGIGSNAFGTANDANGKVAHNIFLALVAETGIIGFSLFMIILAIVFYQLKFLPRWEIMFWLTILIVWFLGAITHNLEARKQTWLFLSLVVVNANLAQQYTASSSLVKSVANRGGLAPQGQVPRNLLQHNKHPDVQADAATDLPGTLLIGKQQ